MGKEAVLACRELTKIVVMSALQKSDVNFKQTWETLWIKFKKMFLATTFTEVKDVGEIKGSE